MPSTYCGRLEAGIEYRAGTAVLNPNVSALDSPRGALWLNLRHTGWILWAMAGQECPAARQDPPSRR